MGTHRCLKQLAAMCSVCTISWMQCEACYELQQAQVVNALGYHLFSRLSKTKATSIILFGIYLKQQRIQIAARGSMIRLCILQHEKIWLSQLNAGPAMRNREGLTPYEVATQSRCFAASIALLGTSRAGRPDLSVTQLSLYYDAGFDGSKKSACNMTAAPQQVTTAIRPLHASILQDCFTPVLHAAKVW